MRLFSFVKRLQYPPGPFRSSEPQLSLVLDSEDDSKGAAFLNKLDFKEIV